MADPLSVAGSIAGLLSISAKAISVLSDYIKKTAEAPSIVSHVLSEVNAIRAALSQLEDYINGNTRFPKNRAFMVEVGNVETMLVACVMTFSELENEVDELKVTVDDLGIIDRMKWAHKEGTIKQLLQKLDSQKISLTLMLSILNSKSSAEALRSVAEMNDSVSGLRRMLGNDTHGGSAFSNVETDSVNETLYTAPSNLERQRQSGGNVFAENVIRRFGFEFEGTLNESRVYKRALMRGSSTSLTSWDIRKTSWSVLSRSTQGNISNISVFSLQLPLYAHDIPNSQWYSFGTAPNSSANRPSTSLKRQRRLLTPRNSGEQQRLADAATATNDNGAQEFNSGEDGGKPLPPDTPSPSPPQLAPPSPTVDEIVRMIVRILKILFLP